MFAVNMMRFAILLLIVSLSACKQKVQPNNIALEKTVLGEDSAQLYSIEKAKEHDFLNAVENKINNPLYDTAILKKINGKIKLPISNKNGFLKFSDTLLNTDEIEAREYTYVGQFEKLGLYIVQGNFWEHMEYYLIDKRTGIQTTLWNYPKVSPNENFIANLSMPYGLEGIPNGLQIWRLVKKGNPPLEQLYIIKYLEIDQQVWAPIDLVWDTDKVVILKVKTVENYLKELDQSNKNTVYYLRLKLNI